MEEIALVTEQHNKHAKSWIVSGYSLPKLCIACVIFRLERKGETDICCKKILEELLAILSSGNGTAFVALSSDSRVLQHLSNILFEMLESSCSKAVKQVCVQVIISLSTLRSTIGSTVLQQSVQWIISAHNLSCSLDHVMLVGKLLHVNSELCQQLIKYHGDFVDHLISGLSYPDEAIKSECAYVLNQMATEYKSLNLCTIKKLCSAIVSMPIATKSHDCTVNMLGLIKGLLSNSTHAQFLVQADHVANDKKGLNLAVSLKRVLLSTDESLQIAAVQCVKIVLDQYPDFCKYLLAADIAEFLFEGLISKNEVYLRSAFEVLSEMANTEEFYTLYHSIYGIEALVSHIEAISRWQCNDLAMAGYDLLSKILFKYVSDPCFELITEYAWPSSRNCLQPISIPLVTSSPLLSQLFTLIHHGLSRDMITINMAACSVLISLLRLHHMTVSYSVQSLLQLLAHCARILEPLVDEDGVTNEDVHDHKLYKFFGQCLAVMFCALRLCTVDSHNVTKSNTMNIEEKEEILQFLLQTFDQVYLPGYLLHHDEFNISDNDDNCDRNFFQLASYMLQYCPKNELAHKLAYCGLIQIGWQVKNKYCHQNCSQLLESVDEFIAVLCHHLTLGFSRNDGQQVEEMLKESLPKMSLLMDENLQYLSQRYCESGSFTEKRQVATICIIYWAFLLDDQIVQPFFLLNALSDYICAHPDAHLLQVTTLQQVIFLFATCCTQINTLREPVYNCQTASQILGRAMLRVSRPESMFVPHPVLWNWVLQQPSLIPVSTNWMVQLLRMISNDKSYLCTFHSVWKNPTDYFASFGEDAITVMDILLDIVCSTNGDVIAVASEILSDIIKNMELIITKHSNYFVVMESVQKRFLATQRLIPLPDEGSVALLKLLTHICTISRSVQIDIKVVYQVTNCILRSTENSSAFLLASLNLLYVVLHSSTIFSSQVNAFLVGNTKFVEKLSSLIPTTTSGQKHSLVSGLAMLIMAVLQVTNVISIPALLAALTGQLTIVQVSALYLWQTIIKQNGRTDFSLNCSSGQITYQNIRGLLFLMQNALVKDTSFVRESTVACYAELLACAHSAGNCMLQQQWNAVIAEYILNLYYNELAPTAFIKYLAIILHYKLEPDTVSVKRIAQFVYRQLMIGSNEKDLTEHAQIIYAACFGEITIRGCQNLNWEEWKHTGSLLLCTAKQSIKECHNSIKYFNYIVIDGVTVCGSHLWPTQEENFKEALRAYALMFESNAELN